MELRKSVALAAGTLFLATAGITVATPATAAPTAGSTVVSSSDPWPSRSFRQGFRDGRKDGWREARDECENPKRAMLKGLRDRGESDYMRGYEEGWDRGYAEGYREFCGHGDDY